MLRKTKIIATLGPATDSPEIQRDLIAAGATVFRINMSHAPHEVVRRHVRQIREIAAATGAYATALNSVSDEYYKNRFVDWSAFTTDVVGNTAGW
jgi:pyruvate kinase